MMPSMKHYTRVELEQKRRDFYGHVLEALNERSTRALAILGEVLEGTPEEVLGIEIEEPTRARKRGPSLEMTWLKLQVSTSLSVLRMARMYAMKIGDESAETQSGNGEGISELLSRFGEDGEGADFEEVLGE